MRFRFAAPLLGFAVLLLLIVPASAQVSDAKIAAIQKRLNQTLKAYNKIPARYQKLLDGQSNLLQIARTFNQMAPKLRKPFNRASLAAAMAEVEAPSSGVVKVNNNSTDLDFSGFAGFTQSETSTALCGSQAVVGFNDSGSFLQTLPIPGIGLSFAGAAVSSNRGASFKDVGFMPPGPSLANFVIGDPVLSCVDSSTFYYTQIFQAADADGNPISSVSLSKSTDGGHTWGDPAITVPKDGFEHSIDKPWSTIDPSNPMNIYISYTDFDFSGTTAACPDDFRNAIEVVASNDGGMTFGNPIIIDEVCGATNDAVQGSHVVVSSNGTVNVAWGWFANFPIGAREFRFTSFAPGGSPAPHSVISSITGVGDSFFLQGTFRDFLGIDFAVDHSGGSTDGTLYATWDDGRDKIIPDLFSTSGSYAFADVLVSSSFDGGNSWDFFPVKVNSDTQPRIGYGNDHYQPGIAVDPTGKVAVCWYDRRNDPKNFSIQRFCGESADGGFSWSNWKVAVPTFPNSHGEDGVVNSIYEGDYDGLTSDTLKSTNGFIGAFGVITDGSNPDVKAYTFQ